MEKIKKVYTEDFMKVIDEIEKKCDETIPVKVLLIMLSIIHENSKSDEAVKDLINNLYISNAEDAVRKILFFISNTMLYNLYDYLKSVEKPEVLN